MENLKKLNAILHFDQKGKLESILLDCGSDREEEIIRKLDEKDLDGKMLLLRIEGILESGKPSDIDFNRITNKAGMKVIGVKKNISKLKTKEFQEITVRKNLMVDDIEKELIEESMDKIDVAFRSKELILAVMNALKEVKKEGETNATYEERIKNNAKRVLGL